MIFAPRPSPWLWNLREPSFEALVNSVRGSLLACDGGMWKLCKRNNSRSVWIRSGPSSAILHAASQFSCNVTTGDWWTIVRQGAGTSLIGHTSSRSYSHPAHYIVNCRYPLHWQLWGWNRMGWEHWEPFVKFQHLTTLTVLQIKLDIVKTGFI